MSSQVTSSPETPSDPVIFDEEEYKGVSVAIVATYRRSVRALFGPTGSVDRTIWFHEFRSFKIVIRLSMWSLNDDDMASVNYCRHTLIHMANYHEVTTRLCREMEDYHFGRGERLSWEAQAANIRALVEARKEVRKAWKRDLEAGLGLEMLADLETAVGFFWLAGV